MANSNPGQHKLMAMGQKIKKGGSVKKHSEKGEKREGDSDADDLACGGKVVKKKKGGKC